jgi:hypothetical protein
MHKSGQACRSEAEGWVDRHSWTDSRKPHAAAEMGDLVCLPNANDRVSGGSSEKPLTILGELSWW